jgi:hypothetical protein
MVVSLGAILVALALASFIWAIKHNAIFGDWNPVALGLSLLAASMLLPVLVAL